MSMRYLSLATFLLVAIVAAVVAARFPAGDWFYSIAARPGWTPAPWLLAAAWAAAWLLAAGAAWQAWLSEHLARHGAVAWWLATLGLAIASQFLFFGLHRPGWAWLAFSAALVVGGLCLNAFRRLSGAAAGLMLLFLLWLAFNWALALAVWTLNGGPLQRLLA